MGRKDRGTTQIDRKAQSSLKLFNGSNPPRFITGNALMQSIKKRHCESPSLPVFTKHRPLFAEENPLNFCN